MVALVVVSLAALWLVGISLLMALRPQYCLELFEKMASSLVAGNWRLNLTEQGLRIVAGAGLVLRSPLSKAPLVFGVAGWCLVVSSVTILALPIRFHASYGLWCLRWLNPVLVRVLSPVPAIAGLGIIYAAL